MVKMDDGLPIVGPSVDLSQAPAINQKRILAFVNHFVSHTVRFLNKFSASCEQKLADIQMRIQRLEITLDILEAKLSSIPGLENITASAANNSTDQTETTTTINKSNENNNENNDTSTNNTVQPVATTQESSETFLKVSKDPRYERFFKMALVGVPVPAVKNKMAAEGLDPNLLDNPDAPAPGGGVSMNADDSDGSSSDASSFSDSD